MKPLTAQQVAEYQKQHQQSQSATLSNVNAGDVTPSSNFQKLDHSAFQISYPSNWKVFGDQNSSVTIAPAAGVGQNAIAYGVVISGFKPQQGTQSIEQATQELVQFLLQSNPQMTVASEVQPININGVRGESVTLLGPSPIQSDSGTLAERDQLVTVPRPDGSVLFLIFIAPQRDFDRLSAAFQQMLQTPRVK